jgi:hypothetical protein
MIVQQRGCEGVVGKHEMAAYTASTRWWTVRVRA